MFRIISRVVFLLTVVSSGCQEGVRQVPSIFVVTVDYDRSFAEAKSDGEFGLASANFEKAFLADSGKAGRRSVTMGVFSSPEEMQNEGWTPATIRELVAFGQIERRFPMVYPSVVALGTVFETPNGRKVPYINRGCSGRDLEMLSLDKKVSCRYLGVKQAVLDSNPGRA